MASERARFAQEVAEVERWWKVLSILYMFLPVSNVSEHRAPALRASFAPTPPPISSQSAVLCLSNIPQMSLARSCGRRSANTLSAERRRTHTERK